uniref:Ig-like domain-containing protein n=1 Tax=Pelusios castaneus TaxID=367368 RepID=A0A8C8SQS4_9SAUR
QKQTKKDPVFLLLWVLWRQHAEEEVAHSLQYFVTAVSDPAPGLPAYVSLGYLDDHVFVEFDSENRLYKTRARWIEDNVGADYWESGTKRGVVKQDVYRVNVRTVMKRYNQTGGFHTLQFKNGCAVWENGSTAGFLQFAYDGKDFLSFDMDTYTWIATAREAEITQRRWNGDTAILQYQKHYTAKQCIDWLTKYWQFGKEALQRREPTAVLVSDQAAPDGLPRLSCRVYGFYPRDIAVTWMKNGEMRKQETQRGDVLPSGDGTYQVQASMEIDVKEGGRVLISVRGERFWVFPTGTDSFSISEPRTNWIPIVAVLAVLMAAALFAVGFILRRRLRSGTGPWVGGFLPCVDWLGPAALGQSCATELPSQTLGREGGCSHWGVVSSALFV